MTPKLTVNLGVRYDRTFIPPYGNKTDDNIAVGTLNLNDGNYYIQNVPPTCASKGKAPCLPSADGSLPAHVVVDPRGKLFHDTTMNWQPRVGAAYRLRPNTALRASFGIFFDEWSSVAQLPQNLQGLWPSVALQMLQNLNIPNASQPLPTVKGVNPFVESSILPPATPFKTSQLYVDPFLKNPYSMQWNLGIQHQLNSSTVVTLNYVGSGTRRLPVRAFYNTAPTPGPGNPQDRAPYPYIRPASYDWSWGKSDYDALQFLFDKKYSNGLATMVSYTYSKSIDIGCSGFVGEGCNVQDPYHLNTSRSVSGFDLTHVLAVNFVYELPVGAGRRFKTGVRAADYVIGNWQLNGISIIRSGPPYTVNVNGDIANIGQGGVYMRPNLIGDPTLPNPSPSAWVNKAAFAPPAQYTFGNLDRNRLRSDWTRNVDLSVFRHFRLKETKSVEFRAEAFNAFNTPVFAAPTANLNSPTFGQVFATANNPRQLQFSLKLLF